MHFAARRHLAAEGMRDGNGSRREQHRAGAEPLVHELVPAPSAFEVFRSLSGLAHPVFFDSALQHDSLGRYSFCSADPFEWLWARGGRIHVSDALSRSPRGSAEQSAGGLPSVGALPRGERLNEHANPFDVVAERLARYRTPSIPGLPPFQGGAAGLFGYDLCHHLERLPRPPHDDFEVPDLAVGFYDWVVAFDHAVGRAWLLSTGFPETDPGRRRRRAEQRAALVKRWLQAPAKNRMDTHANAVQLVQTQWPVPGFPSLLSNFSRARYLETAQRAIEYIHAGDCFQVNLAQRLLFPAPSDPVTLYARLREGNPATFAGYLDLGDFVLASASPERFLWMTNGEVETRPIKGTRPRGQTAAEDDFRAQELLHSGKDRAENIMIVDLLRNDLGRVCRYGSVQVPALCRLESYRYVHHLVSQVRGRLREGLGAVDLLRAAFPGGSVTGAPKIRAMEIIAELEPCVRGPYCGSLAYLGFDGTMDSNILIRTFTVGRGWVQFPVGGGIVSDSSPEREYEETWHKAEGLLKALQ
jgi:para-aminobenzoate synthetase component 1